MRKKQRSAGDRISALPDDILHCILRRVKSPRAAAQTILLSRRWPTVWDSYPTVDFNHEDYSRRRPKNKRKPGAGGPITRSMAAFQKFEKSSIRRYSRNPLLRMESLNLSLLAKMSTVVCPEVERLLGLASERKAEEVTVVVRGRGERFDPLIDLPLSLLSNFSAKTLKLEGIAFCYEVGARFIPLKHLQLLDLVYVELEDGAFASLIAGCPLLETIRLLHVMNLRKLRVCNLANLKTLDISYGCQVEEIEIEALQLHTLRIDQMGTLYQVGTPLSKFELTAPRLEVLEISRSNLPGVDLNTMVSKLQHLTSLSLTHLSGLVATEKLKLSVPKLEQFKLMTPDTVEEIELDSGPCLAKFEFLVFIELSGRLNRCVIGQVPASYTREIAFRSDIHCPSEIEHEWFVRLKNLLSMFTNSQTVGIEGSFTSSVRFKEEQVDHHTTPAIDINHLEIKTGEPLRAIDQLALLDGLFWACHPRSVTMIRTSKFEYGRLFETFSSLMSEYNSCKSPLINKHNNGGGGGEGFYEHHNWRRQLKDVTTIFSNKDENGDIEQVDFMLTPLINKHNNGGGGGEGFYENHNWRRQLKDVTTISSNKDENGDIEQVDFMLTWH